MTAPLAFIADPVDSVRRVWADVGRVIGAHIPTCIPCRRRQDCAVRAILDAEEEHAYKALERARQEANGG